jgi:Peptidase family M23
MAVATLASVAGQGVVGKQVSTPWLTGGPYEITQGWGSTNVGSEPSEDRSGKHYSHWHAGVDLSAAGITSQHVVFPHGLGQQATVIYLDNPKGYGTALILRMWTQSYGGHAGGTAQVRNADIYLGHLATRLVKNGQTVRDGDVLAVPDSTGNSTGPHLHFEVRPPDGKYGTDLDPSQWLLQGNAALQGLPFDLNPFDPIAAAITQAEQSVMNTVIGLAQTALGGTMMLSGGVAIGLGLRGLSGKQALGVTRRTAGGLTRRRSEFDLTRQRRQEPGPAVSPAGRTRLRPTLRREVPQTVAPAAGSSVPFTPRTRAEARGLVPYVNGVPAGRATAAVLRRRLPVKAA